MSYSCTLCDKVLDTERGYKIHMNKIHNQVQDKITCDFCGHEFSRPYRKREHQVNCKSRPNQEIVTINKTINNVDNSTINNNIVNNTTNNIDKRTTNNNLNLVFVNSRQEDIQKVLEKLTPINDELLYQYVKDIINRDLPIRNSEEFATRLSRRGLHKCIFSSDSQKRILQWKNGKDKNKLVKDPNGSILAAKTIECTKEQFAELAKNLQDKTVELEEKYESDSGTIDDANNLMYTRERECYASIVSNNSPITIAELGNALSKKAPYYTQVIERLENKEHEDEFVRNFTTSMYNFVYKYFGYLITLSPAFFGSIFRNSLSEHIEEMDDTLFINDDTEDKFFELSKQVLLRMLYDVVGRLCKLDRRELMVTTKHPRTEFSLIKENPKKYVMLHYLKEAPNDFELLLSHIETCKAIERFMYNSFDVSQPYCNEFYEAFRSK